MSQHVRGRTMQIGELAERTDLSLRTSRHYDEVGLLPASRTEGGFRVYSEEDFERLMHIRRISWSLLLTAPIMLWRARRSPTKPTISWAKLSATRSWLVSRWPG